MDIQVALDRIPLDRALTLTAEVAPLVDWVEVGTSMIKQYGLAGLEQVVAVAASTPVLADLKTVDDARFELELAHGAGARSTTVLGLAPRVTLDAAVELAQQAGRELLVDLLGLGPDQVQELVESLPPEVVLGPHVSKDAQSDGGSATDLLGPWAAGRRIAMAGGLTAQDLPGLAALPDLPDLRVIVGSAVTKADNPREAVLELRAASGKES